MNIQFIARVGASLVTVVLLAIPNAARQAKAANFTFDSSAQLTTSANLSWNSQAANELTDATSTDRDRNLEQTVYLGWDILNISNNPFQGSCVLTANALTFSELSLFSESSLVYLNGISPTIVWSHPSQATQKPSVVGGNGYVQVNWDSNRDYKALMDGKQPPSIVGIALVVAGIYGLGQMLKNIVGDE